jgi:hypothetical protein
VGCAQALINAALGRSSSSCCCAIEPKKAGTPHSAIQNPKSGCC